MGTYSLAVLVAFVLGGAFGVGLGAPRADGVTAPSDDGWMVADCDMGFDADEVL